MTTDYAIRKTLDGNIAATLPDARLVVDHGRMSARVIISTDDIDRDRERIIPRGLALGNHARNPQVDFNHNHGVPVGLARDRESGAYTVALDARGWLVGETFFHQGTAVGNQVFEMVEKGALPGISLTMIPVPNRVQKQAAGDGGRPITVYSEGDLVAYSHVWQPANPQCLVEIVHKGFGAGRRLCPELDAICRPLVPERSAAVTSGWDNQPSTVTKAMTDPNTDPTQPPVDDAAADMTDPNAPDAALDDHQENVNEGIGTIAASLYRQFCKKVITLDAAMDKLRKAFELHEAASDLDGDGDVDGGEADLGEDDEDAEDDSDDTDDSPDYAEDTDDDDYEEDEKRPGKKKYLLAWTKASEGTSIAVARHLESEADRSARRADYFRRVIKAFADHGKINAARAAGEAEKLLEAERLSGPVCKRLRDDMDATFGVVRKRLGKRVVTKAAKTAAPAVDEWAEVITKLDGIGQKQETQARELQDLRTVVIGATDH